MRHISFREVDGSDYFHLCLIIKEGKSQLVIAIGCTGGQHRSVTLTEYLGKHLKPSIVFMYLIVMWRRERAIKG